ncbi:hypothetical protein GKR48_12870 [Providencia sp. wls1943]|uniref:hypothetical protein n=1 Tax=Providencia sp. wls1943 TaxID=2675150 RepID=UPI0012B508DF|nr:hypothetical protein [Providencia sp. wls1943]MTB67707.1 hypothetical protein [Providencia sp. wls1943]
MSFIKNSSIENNNNIFLNKEVNHDAQKKSGFKNALNKTIGYFISSVQNKLDSINEMICRKKIIRSHHSAVEAIECKLGSNSISVKSLRKIECKFTKINKNYSFLDSVDIKKEIISKTKSANEPVREKISKIIDRKFGIDIYRSEEKTSSMVKLENDFIDSQVSNRTVSSDVNDTVFLNLVKNHQMIPMEKKDNRINKDSYILSKIEEVDVEEDNENNLSSFKKDTEELIKALYLLKMKFKTRENELGLRDAYKVHKSSFN